MAYRMTAARKVALRKAQLASARKRKRNGRMSPRQHRRTANREKYGSRRKGLTKAQYKARKVRTNRRIATGIAYGFTGVYVGAIASMMAPNTSAKVTRKAKSAAKRYGSPKKAIRGAQAYRTNRQFNKIIKANY